MAAAAALVSFAPVAGQSSNTLVIRGATLIDGTGRAPVAGATVVVEGNRITKVTTETVATPPGAQVIDGKGRFLIPGLMDVHVHLRGAGGRGVHVDDAGLRPSGHGQHQRHRDSRERAAHQCL